MAEQHATYALIILVIRQYGHVHTLSYDVVPHIHAIGDFRCSPAPRVNSGAGIADIAVVEEDIIDDILVAKIRVAVDGVDGVRHSSVPPADATHDVAWWMCDSRV